MEIQDVHNASSFLENTSQVSPYQCSGASEAELNLFAYLRFWIGGKFVYLQYLALFLSTECWGRVLASKFLQLGNLFFRFRIVKRILPYAYFSPHLLFTFTYSIMYSNSKASSSTLTYLIVGYERLFISESKFHPGPARFFNFTQKSTHDMIHYVVNNFFHPARLFRPAFY